MLVFFGIFVWFHMIFFWRNVHTFHTLPKFFISFLMFWRFPHTFQF